MSTSQTWTPALTLTLAAGSVDWTQIVGGHISYGKSGDALSYSGGTMTLTLQNYDGRYTPGDTGATHGGETWIGRDCVLYADDTLGIDPVFFAGQITSVEFTMASQTDSTVTLIVSDVLGQLSTEQLTALAVVATTSEGQLNEVLAGSDVGQTTVINPSGDAGKTLLTSHSPITTTAGAQIALIEQSDGGDVYTRAGRAVAGGGVAGDLHFRTYGQPPSKGGEVGDCTFAESTDIWTKTSHGMFDGDPVQFSAIGTGPTAEFLIITRYWVIASTTNTFQLSATEGGSAITSGSDSAGTWTLAHDHFLCLGDSSSGEQFKFRSLGLATGGQVNYTNARFTRIGGTVQESSAPTTYGTRSIVRTGLLSVNDAAALTLADEFLIQYGPDDGAPTLQVKEIVGQPITWSAANTDHELVWYAPGDLVNLAWTGPGPTAVQNNAVGIISKMTWKLTPTAFTPTWELENGRYSAGSFILDDATFGVLDTSVLG